MSEMNRREALTLIALAPLAGAAGAVPAVAATRAEPAPPPRSQQPRFLTPHEVAVATLLADLIIPADERSGSASSAGTIEFIDFIVQEPGQENARVALRGGLAWMDAESRRRYAGRGFREIAEAERTAILDDIAWPARARPEMSHGVAFFSRFRDMVASGFWSSRTGVQDLRYVGNVPVPEWRGCSDEALRKLGVSYPTG